MYKVVVIDGVGYNATHFASFDDTEAVKQVIADGFTKDKEYAAKIVKACKAEVQKSEKK